jgi:hypothetical protein
MKLGGQVIPTPKQNISINYIEIVRSERTATGRLVKDVIALKRQFSIPYAGLKPTEAQIFVDAYETGEPVLFEYTDVQGVQTAIVYVMSLPREIYSYKPNYTQNITITLEEQ